MTLIVEPGHVEASNNQDRACPHCGRPVAAGESIVLSLRDPGERWLPADCYAEVWAAELEHVARATVERGELPEQPFDPTDVETLVELPDGSVISHDEWLGQAAEREQAARERDVTDA